MKIGFSQNYNGPGGARSWIEAFSKYCISKGHTVSYGFDDTVDVFCSVANLSTYKELELLKNKKIKIMQRLGAIYLPYNHPNPLLIKNKNDELKNLISFADSIVYQSHFSKEVLFRSIYNGSEPNGDIIYNSANSNLFTPTGEKLPNKSNKKIILAAAYWGTPDTATKSLNLLSSVISHYSNKSDIEFWVLGRAFAANQRSLSKLNFRNVSKLDLLNPIPRENMPTILRSVDMVLHLKAHEGCSNMVIETMHTGTPLVGINSGSLPELVKESALLADCDNSLDNFPNVNLKDLIYKIDKTLSNLDFYSNKVLNQSKNFSYSLTYELYLKKLFELVNKT
ncbi:MAG: glycosyltransferase family 4 protein [Clostridium sp.]|nr:glycosyltransferase family 4 protein [Clostridium sp.]